MSSYETAQFILATFGVALAAFCLHQVREIKKLQRWDAEQDRIQREAARPPAE